MTTLLPTLLAGDEFASPTDFPSNRIDPGGASSPYNAVGALQINGSGGGSFFGSAIALSPPRIVAEKRIRPQRECVTPLPCTLQP